MCVCASQSLVEAAPNPDKKQAWKGLGEVPAEQYLLVVKAPNPIPAHILKPRGLSFLNFEFISYYC